MKSQVKVLFCVLALGGSALAGSAACPVRHGETASPWEDFASPPDSARPWCYWWWINGHVDRETITADLESMRELGFGGVLMVDSRGYWDDDEHVVNPPAEIAWGSEAWYDNVEFAVRECARLGLAFTMNASASGGTLNGFADGKEYETDIMDRAAVRAHLDRALGPLLRRVPELVGTTFTHVYSVSYEGSVRTGGSWRAVKDAFYATLADWAHAHGLKVYSESGGPWCWGSKDAKLDCDQLDMLAHNDFPQGEFWPLAENGLSPETGHANANARFFSRAAVLSARREKRKIVSMEAFTHMHRHWSVDPAFLKPLADMAYADGVNRLVWHTFTCSPRKFGIPGAEYFAGSHINRNVTWQKDAAPFVRYLGRCQALLQRGEPVDDGEFANVRTNYHGWGRFRKDERARFTTTHRREKGADFFFVAGEGRGRLTVAAAAAGRSVEVWDPVAVTRRKAEVVSRQGDTTTVALDLPQGGSCFLVFLKDGDAPADPTVPCGARTLDGTWSVSFAFHPGIAAQPPKPVEMETLRDFTSFGTPDGADSGAVRYFSGTATYRTTVPLAAEERAQAVAVDVGALKTGVARVLVNGVDCGTAWCAPWRVRAEGVWRTGENVVEIRYVNNWHNRLVGDCRLPAPKRVTQSTVRYWNVPRRGDPSNHWSYLPRLYSGPSAFDPLQPSGLLGPVKVVFGGKAADRPDAAAVGRSPAPPRYGQLLRVPFGHCGPEHRPAFWRALDARPGAFTELALFSRFSNGAETLDYHRQMLTDVAAFVREGKARGYTLGVNILPSVAFPEVFASQRVPNGRNRVFNDGVEHVGTLCMNAPETRAYVRDLCALYASTGIDFLYLDDDVDLAHCFCPACCGDFSARVGRPIADVNGFKAELDAGDPVRRRKARNAWIDMADEVRARLFAAAAGGAHSVSPRIELGCMTCGNAISDTAGGRWSAALAGDSGTRVRWRPGGGSWTDRSREDLLRKIDTCLLQIRGADAWIQFEEESFPYHGLGKSPGYLGFECLQYVASGADSVAFNILDASTPSLEDELKPSLDKAAAIAPVLRELHETFGRTPSGGFSFPWGRFAVVAERSPWSDWGRMPKELVLARIGLPAASDPSAAQVILLNGDAAAGMSAAALTNALSRGVMVDADALSVLTDRGFGPLVGFAPDGTVPRTTEFRDLDHPLNLPGRRTRKVFYSLTSGREREIAILRKTDARAEFVSAADGSDAVLGHNAGVFENDLGGRVAVSTQLAFTECEGLPRAEHLKRLFRWLSRETLPGYVKSFHRVVLRARGKAFFAANFSSDAVRDVELALLGDGAYDVSVFVGGEKKECFRLAPAGRDGPYGIYRLPELPNLGQALLVSRERQ